VWERRSAIVTTSYIIKQEDVSDTFQIAEVLLDDLIHKATGEWLRAAGKKDRQRLMGFLDEYATMPRYAIEHLDKERRAHYLSMNKPALTDHNQGDRS
jgi:3-methyladenine DNA glycosylase AlkD